ncbi:hypothetical protein BaRGS_00004971 [Batillaria attramentaria]|uniref:Death ligand signal enhancer n=1 Tax=Batillaria attramentaria TaxID=370345 RepID=A0ABD0LXM5_9CAEN
MWRIWNSIPRVVRQHFHGPRASAGVYVEEERAELDTDRFTCSNHGSSCSVRSEDSDRHALCVCPEQKCGSSEEEGERRRADNEQQGWGHRPDFWSFFFGRHRALEAVTWGAAVVLGLQLSRQNHLQQYLELLKNREKQQQWRWLVLRVAFAMPPDFGVSSARSILQKTDTDVSSSKDKKKKKAARREEAKPAEFEDEKSLEDVMQDFQASCRQYTAIGSSVSGIYAAEEGHLTDAVKHLQLSSQLGHAPSYFNLALCYQMGYGVEKDLNQAATYYRMAADVGHAQAVFNLALMTMNGEGGITKDKERAMELLNTAAMQGLAQAQTYLGVYYTEVEDDQQDFEQAASFFQAAADQDDAEGQYLLGICYENGWGVESSDEEAAKLYAAAAESGHDGALYNLAAFHEHGLGGLKQDKKLAMDLYQQSAKSGNQSAEFRLQETDAHKAVSEWHELNSTEEFCQPVPPALRRSPHSSSPSLTDCVRDSLAKLWIGDFSRWSSVQNIPDSTSSESRPMFSVGGSDSAMNLADIQDGHMVGLSRLNIPDRCSVSGLQRTSTMPDLCFVPCP